MKKTQIWIRRNRHNFNKRYLKFTQRGKVETLVLKKKRKERRWIKTSRTFYYYYYYTVISVSWVDTVCYFCSILRSLLFLFTLFHSACSNFLFFFLFIFFFLFCFIFCSNVTNLLTGSDQLNGREAEMSPCFLLRPANTGSVSVPVTEQKELNNMISQELGWGEVRRPEWCHSCRTAGDAADFLSHVVFLIKHERV